MMLILWENYSGSGLGLRIYIFRILDSILQPMHAGWYPGLWRERDLVPPGKNIYFADDGSEVLVVLVNRVRVIGRNKVICARIVWAEIFWSYRRRETF